MEESLKIYSKIKEVFQMGEVDVKTYSPLTLAFIGDCVFDLVIRSYVVAEGNRATESLHKSKSRIVKASAQAAMIDRIYDSLTPEEQDIYRRGRNAKSHTMAKNASMADYRKATGLEALCGYLYLQDRTDRILELIKLGMEEESQGM